MLKIIIAAVISSSLFIVGGLILKPQKKAKIVFDYQDYCDEDRYMLSGSTFFEPQEIPALAPGIKFFTMLDGQTLHSILRPQNISEQEIFNLGKALSPYLLVKDLSAGDQYFFS